MKLLALAFAALVLVAAPIAGGARDPRSPQLHPTTADTRRAAELLLPRAAMPSGFGAVSSAASSSNNGCACGGVDPDLHALTETGEAYGDALVSAAVGAYMSDAFVFVSRVQAAKAQSLDSASDTSKCAVAIARKFMKGAHARAGSPRLSFVGRRIKGATVTERQALFAATIAGRTSHVQAALISCVAAAPFRSYSSMA
jgi:hypothetical protein